MQEDIKTIKQSKNVFISADKSPKFTSSKKIITILIFRKTLRKLIKNQTDGKLSQSIKKLQKLLKNYTLNNFLMSRDEVDGISAFV